MRDIYYDRNGQPDSMEQWNAAFSRDRHIGRTKVAEAADLSKSIEVSTVWLGLDHRFTSNGPPLIFETMAFGEGSAMDQACERYSTEEQAREGHHAMVTCIAATLIDPVVIDF